MFTLTTSMLLLKVWFTTVGTSTKAPGSGAIRRFEK